MEGDPISVVKRCSFGEVISVCRDMAITVDSSFGLRSCGEKGHCACRTTVLPFLSLHQVAVSLPVKFT
jgi:hypothetical protein